MSEERIEQTKAVDEWIGKFKVELTTSEEGLTVSRVDIPEIDTMLLRGVLESYGAEFNPEKEGIKKLSQPTNKFRRPGMNAVWGEKFMENYNAWTVAWANTYEETGRKLPKLDQSGNRTSGMRHFLGELTALAAGHLSFDKFKEHLEARIVNGSTYTRGLGKSPTDILPESKRFPGSIPPYFVDSAWEVIKSRELIQKVPEISLPPDLLT
ncbi:hypothetical protein A2962_00355 [Candidatus Woesebacteria bacterium RIFCSPLOWO2_01_FULL_39_61]|uniref:Uncharacterized protein n=1 Tax=Candidatus Woesebacteria bacterium RIFCSPHIGHO2_02_FULL_39_13 TaxID=1802505 RepID=A0A1F7YZM4_9BACT|nr:MAG: hypothetical protein A2692_05565 [Candidatus Woesebacteria bacterium RIFCSPHIGHO2_01_FULL_39_95]OGM32741.1 MAG: hypothetical protein A3D01_01035 [Candidatus Woesebacteria bacterium RIFCSPHIGHO2_02_FULL_39_13]OGM37914.1 MAG: hypothetical protein A3E13_04385 [Candidatus Woesebacteria bacterium RIFCSPHIGHO2_12_FULL_40_20]OGM66344.1 MAG: hypothetical protein A2962_00355 [Candidatus Woesebacteria bacterium RIFCSPLOWO2_01_FULL_39_61]